MKQLLAASFVILASLGSVEAETITFEADGGVVIVRSYDQFGMAVVEFVGAAGAIYQCVVLDAAGEPIATAAAMADVGQMMIQGLQANRISDVKCRRTM